MRMAGPEAERKSPVVLRLPILANLIPDIPAPGFGGVEEEGS